jgi:hypothetical protein
MIKYNLEGRNAASPAEFLQHLLPVLAKISESRLA